ncbi:DUF2569 domain-containing protein [Acerihabitans arboris]|uniref:DUF2569 family protein n=1 Tax=Acerihabitans arboris TaxID=2691583 RepID=A0A845SDV8_9GAMM|nr:DUF2569 domain-containing protein [Acerihabitans arboris]NDL63113.1 DUF2569 family protein [Acerihabitans arboris]
MNAAPNPAPRIGGWLWLPAAYLILALLGASMMTVIFLLALLQRPSADSATIESIFTLQWYASMATTLAMWCFTFWTLRLLLRRSVRFPKVFILWLLAGILLALKAFAFSPVTDELALRILFWPLLAAATMVPYIKRSRRVKSTFIQP